MKAEPRISDEHSAERRANLRTTAGTRGWLGDYEAAKFDLAGLIREAGSAATQSNRDNLQYDLRGLLKRLAEDRFYLTLAGQFSRGKTTLMNAVFGMDSLPTGVVPVTSVITAVSYNSRERVVMHFEGSNLTHEVPLSEIREWITEQGNPGNRRKIELAEVQLPAEILRRGAFFVDTPGLGSAIVENTATTHRFLPQIDALVLVTSFEFPLSEEEILFLRKLRGLRRRVFVTVNKADLCSPEQRNEVLEFIRRRLAEDGYPEDWTLFAVSAREALAAKIRRDDDRLNQSGLPEFEQAIVKYLVSDRYGDLLLATCQRLESLLKGGTSPESVKLAQRVQEFQSRLRSQQTDSDEPTRTPLVDSGRSVKVSSCFVCKQMADETFKFMSQFQYDLSHSRDEQLFHASRSGFCTLHTREYARLASPQGIASGYPAILLSLAERLRSLSHGEELIENWKLEFNRILPDRKKCPACQAVADTETLVIREFVRETGQEPPEDDHLPCVCLRHLYAILEQAPATELSLRFLLRSATVLERTAENMERFALRHGGLHMELATDEELASPERGLNLLVGQPNVRPVGSD